MRPGCFQAAFPVDTAQALAPTSVSPHGFQAVSTRIWPRQRDRISYPLKDVVGMYKLYIANKNYSSWSLRPWILMRALSISFEETLVPFETGSSREKFREFSPNACVPCLHDGTQVVWDSLAIVEYLAERHAGVWPADVAARAWARSAVCEMHSGFFDLRQCCPMNCGVRIELTKTSEGLELDLARIDELWTEALSRFRGPFLTGPDFSAADAFFAPVVFRAQTYALTLGDDATRYVEHMLQHEFMRQWYEAALREPWRDSAHEEGAAELGTVRADHRA